MAFFAAFIATFAAAALAPVIRENLNADKWQMGNAGVVAVCGAIFSRVAMGMVVDNIGPRQGLAFTMFMFAPACFLMSMVESVSGFAAVRFFIGCSLCAFVMSQFWAGTMFNQRIVGTANAFSAGWGNLGGGFTHLIMPLIYQGIKHGGVPGFAAWRWAFFVPGAVFMVLGLWTLIGTMDTPDSDYRTMRARGKMAKDGNWWASFKCGMGNYRTWIMFLTYGYCFGVELTVDNIITTYLYDQFLLPLHTAGILGAIFGLMNIFSRASGGIISDLVAIRWGMRGRLWALWIAQTLGGVFCIVMAYVDYSLGATIGVMVVFSIFCQQSCGFSYGIVPFISRRSYGLCSGFIGAGGNVGGVVTQVIFFIGSRTSPDMTTQEGLKWMGVMTIAMTALLVFVHFPAWGSMFLPGNPDVDEEDYYIKEWSAEEIASGVHHGAMLFATNSRSQRGSKWMDSKRGKERSVHLTAAVDFSAEKGIKEEAPVIPANRA